MKYHEIKNPLNYNLKGLLLFVKYTEMYYFVSTDDIFYLFK